MNLCRPPLAVLSHSFPILADIFGGSCRGGSVEHSVFHDAAECPRIEKVYVINLDREPGRWSGMEQELRNILDSSGTELLRLTERHVAVDANDILAGATQGCRH